MLFVFTRISLVKGSTLEVRLSEHEFISRNNSHLRSRSCRLELGQILNSNMAS
jgi:hypothetical protein